MGHTAARVVAYNSSIREFAKEWITILLKKWLMRDSNQEKTILCSLTIDGDHTPMYPKYCEMLVGYISYTRYRTF